MEDKELQTIHHEEIEAQIQKLSESIQKQTVEQNKQNSTRIRLPAVSFEAENNIDNNEITKRSDDSEFQNWEITTVKSGKFGFTSKEQDNPASPVKVTKPMPQNMTKIIPDKSGKQKGLKLERQKGNNNRMILKSKSLTKKQKEEEFTRDFETILASNKLVKIVYSHFCKENYLSSIKSTLFEDKQKIMEEMSLNKWMVFCKEYNIFSGLVTLKAIQRQSEVGKEVLGLENSVVREQVRVKQIKQVQKKLIKIFKKSADNKSKMQFVNFVKALRTLFEIQFSQKYQFSQQGLHQFLNEMLYCTQQKDCFKKLSMLKLTFTTPQIEYQKVNFPLTTPINHRSKSKNDKENQTKRELKKSQSLVPHDFKKLSLNPIIHEAKKTVQNSLSTYQIGKLKQHKQVKSKLVLGQSSPFKKKTQLKSDLIEYFESSRDDILQSYFQVQRSHSVKNK